MENNQCEEGRGNCSRLKSDQLSRRMLSSPGGSVPQAGQVDVHLGVLSGLKMHLPHWGRMLHRQQLSPLGCLSGHPLKMPACHSQSLAPQSESSSQRYASLTAGARAGRIQCSPGIAPSAYGWKIEAHRRGQLISGPMAKWGRAERLQSLTL